MDLPVMPPVSPMLAKAARELPAEGGWAYEPKWDGFRTVVFRDGIEVELGSRNERPLTRYFPELIGALRSALPERCVLDGEVVIAGPAGLDFDALLQRIHPAGSRVKLLAEQTPASFVAFDMLSLGDLDLRPLPLARRREALAEVLASAAPPLHLTPATTDRGRAQEWFERFEGAGLDGVVAKSLSLAYLEGARSWVKVKHQRTADCVVGGFRWYRGGGGVGSLLLGLHDSDGILHHVGVTAAFTQAQRLQLVDVLAPYATADLGDHPWAGMPGADRGADHGAEHGAGRRADPTPAAAPPAPAGGVRRPGGQSRWSAGKDLSWEPLSPELVCEVAYDHLQGNRFRHAARFVRWRPDRSPQTCRYDQLEVAPPGLLADVFGA